MTSEQYLRQMEAQGPQDWGAAVRFLRAETGSKAASILASAFGVSRRTGERWIAKAQGSTSQASTPKTAVQVGLVGWAKRRYVASKLRTARALRVGSVIVAYAGQRDARPRQIGTLPVVGVLRTALDVAADLIESGDYATAADRLDAGVLDAYGVPEGTLEIDDYPGGLSMD